MEGWKKMEEAGAVFLSAAGYTTFNGSYGNFAFYESTTACGSNARYTPGFYIERAGLEDYSYNSTGISVRLVANVISYTVPASGMGRFSIGTAVTLPEGLKAYYCKDYDSEASTIATKEITGTIPANTGVLLRGDAGETYTITASSETPEPITDNVLVAAVEAIHVNQPDGDYTNFMMSEGKFIKIVASSNPDDKIPANKAYLPILTSAVNSDIIELK